MPRRHQNYGIYSIKTRQSLDRPSEVVSIFKMKICVMFFQRPVLSLHCRNSSCFLHTRGMRSWKDCILGTDHRLFRNVAVWDPRQNSDHYMVLGCLPSTPPDGAQEVPEREETVAGEAVKGTNTDGSTFCGSTESRTKGATARGETKRLDFGVDVETHQQESLRMPGPAIRAGLQATPGEGGTEEPGDRQETAGVRSGGGGRGFGEGGPAPHTGGVVPPSGVVKGCN